MSYDLTLPNTPAIAEAVAKLAKKHAIETSSSSDQITLALHVDDEEVVKLYRALLKLARSESIAIHDPQLGAEIDLAAPGRFPPMWGPSTPVHGSSFEAKVKSFLLDHLRPHGFTPRDRKTATRPGERLTQGINFQAGTGGLSGRFTANIYWTFDFRPRVHPSQMDVSRRLEQVLRAEGLVADDDRFRGWLPSKPSKAVERAFAIVLDVFTRVVLPMLDELRSVAAIVAAHEGGRLSMVEAFGLGSQHVAECYGHLGRLDEGRERYMAYLDELAQRGSDDEAMLRWVQGEREQAKRWFDPSEQPGKDGSSWAGEGSPDAAARDNAATVK